MLNDNLTIVGSNPISNIFFTVFFTNNLICILQLGIVFTKRDK